MSAFSAWQVYALIDPRSFEVRYVGLTAASLDRRLYQHVVDAKGGRKRNPEWARWVRSLECSGKLGALVPWEGA